MTLPQAITLVAVSMAAITAIIAVVQQLHIQSLNSEKKDLKQALLTSHKNHTNEREVSAKLEADLKQADKEFDAKCKELIKVKTILDDNIENLQHAVTHSVKYHDLIAMPRRKRDKVIAELRKEMGVKVAKVVNDVDMTPKIGLTHGLTVQKPSDDEANEIFAVAKELGIHIFHWERNDYYCHIWYFSEDGNMGVSNCTILDNDHTRTYVTASEFMTRMRNHASKSH